MWTTFLENPKAITSTFDTEPSLDEVSLYGVELLYDTANFKVHLKDYPQNPPARWKQMYSGANTVALTLQAIGISAFDVSGWSSENFVSCKISRSVGQELSLVIKGDSTEIRIMCFALRVAHISAYTRSPVL